MFDVTVLILAAWVAFTTIVLSIIIRNLSDPFTRVILPLLCGAGLSATFFSPPVFPLMVVSSLLTIEWQAGRRIGVVGIFSGAFITVLVFWVIQKSALTGISHMGGLEFFLWTLCTFLISLFLFFGIACISQRVSGMKKEPAPESDQDPSGTQSDETGGKTDLLVLGVFLSGVFLLLLWPAFLFTFYSPLHDENTAPGSLYLDRLETSGSPGGTIKHLTDEQISRYPALQSLIRNSGPAEEVRSREFGNLTFNVSGMGLSRLPSCSIEKQMLDEGFSQPDTFLEYGGTYYHADIVHYAGQRC
jgi:hypothetical protein